MNATVEQTTDAFGRKWDLSPDELCIVCGQPDNYGECHHRPLSELDVATLGGILQ